MRDLAGLPRGLLRVTAPVALARQQLVPLLADFPRQYPEVRLSSTCRTGSRRWRPRASTWRSGIPRVRPTPMWRGRFARHALAAGGDAGLPQAPWLPQLPQELAGTTACITRASGQAGLDLRVEREQQASERVTVQVRGSLAANNSEALRDAALAGLGIALLPDFSAQASLRAGRLVELLPDWTLVGSFAGPALRDPAPLGPCAARGQRAGRLPARAAGADLRRGMKNRPERSGRFFQGVGLVGADGIEPPTHAL